MIWINKLSIAIVISLLPLGNNAALEQEYLGFFNKFVELGNSFDVSVAEMYSDESVIHIHQLLSDGADQNITMSGSKIKKIIINVMDLAKKRDARSEFSNISISIKGSIARIKASRYSTVNCYHDKNYQVLIKRKMDGTFQVIEEFVASPLQSRCKIIKKDNLKYLLHGVAFATNLSLPMMVDTETRLVKTSAEENTFFFHFKLVNLTPNANESKVLQERMTPVLIKQTCAKPDLIPHLNMGATIAYIYTGKNGNKIFSISIKDSDCNRTSFK